MRGGLDGGAAAACHTGLRRYSSFRLDLMMRFIPLSHPDHGGKAGGEVGHQAGEGQRHLVRRVVAPHHLVHLVRRQQRLQVRPGVVLRGLARRAAFDEGCASDVAAPASVVRLISNGIRYKGWRLPFPVGRMIS